MEWIVGLIGLVIGLAFGFFLGALGFVFQLSRQGMVMKKGKVVPIKSVDPVLVVNFPAGMDEDKAGRILTEAITNARMTGLAEVEQMVEGILRARR